MLLSNGFILMTHSRPRVLFVGASGEFATRSVPALSLEYTLIGVSRKKTELAHYCESYYEADLLRESEKLFTDIFSSHEIQSIIWAPVTYFPRPIRESSREILHTEFDLSTALPLLCIQRSFSLQKSLRSFILVGSGLARRPKESWGSYSIAKASQVMLGTVLNASHEHIPIKTYTLLFGSLQKTTDDFIRHSLKRALDATLIEKCISIPEDRDI